ncbi:uncharacterized protein LOC135689813 isoform X2 [Rhopilema esculentum]|uniref:uncharacterized protein LOC135689813 isoform X2 n=1 Tax=Rhopilema esculentum TaxID=499914 RepID=UPI0031D35D5C
MKGSSCYSVDCKDEKSCLWVDASGLSEPIKLVYITHTDVKAHLSKGNASKAEHADVSTQRHDAPTSKTFDMHSSLPAEGSIAPTEQPTRNITTPSQVNQLLQTTTSPLPASTTSITNADHDISQGDERGTRRNMVPTIWSSEPVESNVLSSSAYNNASELPKILLQDLANANSSEGSQVLAAGEPKEDSDLSETDQNLATVFEESDLGAATNANEVESDESKPRQILLQDLEKIGLSPTGKKTKDLEDQERLSDNDAVQKTNLANTLFQRYQSGYDSFSDGESVASQRLNQAMAGPLIGSESEDDQVDSRDWIVDELANAGTGTQVPQDDFVWSNAAEDLMLSTKRMPSSPTTAYQDQESLPRDLIDQDSENIMLTNPTAFQTTVPASDHEFSKYEERDWEEPNNLLPEFGTDSLGAFVDQNGASGNYGDVGDEIDFEVVKQIKKSKIPLPTGSVKANGKGAKNTTESDSKASQSQLSRNATTDGGEKTNSNSSQDQVTKKQENKMTNFTVKTRTDNTHHRNVSQHKEGERVVSYNVLLHADNTPLPPSKTRDQIGPPSSTVSSAAGKVSQMGRMSNTHDFFRNGNSSLHRHVTKHHQRTSEGHKKYVSKQKSKPLVTKDLQDRSTVLSSEPKRIPSYKINKLHKDEESKENTKIIKEATKLLVYQNDSWLPKPNDNKAQRMVSHLMTFGKTSLKIAECLSNGTKPCVDQNDEKKTKLFNAFFKLHSDDIRSRLANRLVEIGKAAMTKGKELQSGQHYGEQDDLLHEITGSFKAQGPLLKQETNVDDLSYSNHTARHNTENNDRHMDVASPDSKYKGVETSKSVNVSTILIADGSRINQANDSQNRINTNTRVANDDSYKAHLMAAIQNASPTYHKTALCSHGHMHRNVIPRYALHSGEIVLHGIVASMDRCIKYCCASDTCNLALLVKMECFTITCKSEFHCQFIPNKGHRKTEAVHVYRGGLRFKFKKSSHSKDQNTGKKKSSKDHIIAQKNDIGRYQNTIKPLFKKGHETVLSHKHRGLNKSTVEDSTRYLAINNSFRNSLPFGQTNVSNSGLRHSAISRKSNQNDQSKLKNRSVISNASLLLKDAIAQSKALKGKSSLHQDSVDKNSMVNATLSSKTSSSWTSSKRKPLTTPKATYRTVATTNLSRKTSSMSGKQTGTSRKSKDSSTGLRIYEDRWVSQPQMSDIAKQSVNALSATSKHQKTKQPRNQYDTKPLALPAGTNITRSASHVKQTSKVTVEFNNTTPKERLQMTKTHNRRHKVGRSKQRFETTQATPARRFSQVMPTKTTHAAKTTLHTAKTTSPTTTTATTTTTTQTPVTTVQTAAATTLSAITTTPSALTKISYGAATTPRAATTSPVLALKTTERAVVSKKPTTASGKS